MIAPGNCSTPGGRMNFDDVKGIRDKNQGSAVPVAWQLSFAASTSTFNLPPGNMPPTFIRMFDTIIAEMTTAAGKLAHLRRFL